MQDVKMKLDEYFPREELESVSKVITNFHEDCFLNKKLSDKSAIVLVVYMLANKNKKNSVLVSDAKKLFVTLGRKEKSFLNRLSELKKSRKKEGIVIDKTGELKLDQYGLGLKDRILAGLNKK